MDQDSEGRGSEYKDALAGHCNQMRRLHRSGWVLAGSPPLPFWRGARLSLSICILGGGWFRFRRSASWSFGRRGRICLLWLALGVGID